MDRGNAEELLARLGCRRIRVSGGEVMASCPFTENHWRGDRRASFSAHLDPDDRSPYFCFGCHEKGTLESLAIGSGNDDLVPEYKARRPQKDATWMKVPSNNVALFGHLYRKKETPVFFGDHLVEPFLGVLPGYLIERGIKVDTARQWEIGKDKDNRRATFTMRDVEGRLTAVIGRDLTGRSKVKYSNYVWDKKLDRLVPFIDHKREDDFVGPTKRFFLYGENIAWKVMKGEESRRSNDLIVVEGAMDALKVWQYGWNAVALLGSYPSDEQIEKIVGLTPRNGRVIMMMDNDRAGNQCASELGGALIERIPTFVAFLDDDQDPGDANLDELERAVANAQTFSLTAFR